MQNPNNYKAWIGNVFEKDANKTEYLTQVAIYAPEKYTCKVWVNPAIITYFKIKLSS